MNANLPGLAGRAVTGSPALAEAYSVPMQNALTHDVQQASTARLLELLRYFRQRRGPGLGLVEAELRARLARRSLYYPSASHPPHAT